MVTSAAVVASGANASPPSTAVKAGPPATPPDKQLRISPKVRAAIELLATGKCKTQIEAAVAVGLLPNLATTAA